MPSLRTTTVILLYHVLITSEHTQAQRPKQTDLTFAESMFVKLSGACRAVVDFRYISEPAQDASLVKSMKIVYLNGSTIKTFSIDEAYVALTQTPLFDISKQTKIIIHGFRDSSQSSVSMDIAEAYNEKESFNVLLVDAEELMNKWYILSVHNTRLVGKRLANLLANLENFGASADDLHLVGISLGAHTAGWAGKYYQKFKSHRLGRITGLDPAGPCFSHAYSEQRLDKSDADFVDVLHSNRLVQGVIEPLGHADYYLNGGGPNQPGCLMPSCSHLRAANVYAESIKYPKAFLAVRCKSWKHFQANACESSEYAVMGYGTSTSSRGLYYLKTSAASPFGLGMDGTRFTETTTDNMDTWFKIMNLA